MNNLKLDKRKWQGYDVKKECKWFTGYDGDITETNADRYYETWCYPCNHEVRQLKIKPLHTARGRSSAICVWQDNTGFKYNVSLSGTFKMLQEIINNPSKLVSSDGCLVASFVQTKQGANYFIEMVEE